MSTHDPRVNPMKLCCQIVLLWAELILGAGVYEPAVCQHADERLRVTRSHPNPRGRCSREPVEQCGHPRALSQRVLGPTRCLAVVPARTNRGGLLRAIEEQLEHDTALPLRLHRAAVPHAVMQEDEAACRDVEERAVVLSLLVCQRGEVLRAGDDGRRGRGDVVGVVKAQQLAHAVPACTPHESVSQSRAGKQGGAGGGSSARL